ncbi:MAG: hypothetical protein UZ15_CFX003000026 [Chloroflexi bacterium OLB15]|nr:MAG: hypothetical protein UZ15_CFX003000026 [Chloroflexi bacterium OLB15]
MPGIGPLVAVGIGIAAGAGIGGGLGAGAAKAMDFGINDQTSQQDCPASH